MALLIPAVGAPMPTSGWPTWDLPHLARPPHRLAGANPDPFLTEFIQTAYTLFIPAVLLVAFWIWTKRRSRSSNIMRF